MVSNIKFSFFFFEKWWKKPLSNWKVFLHCGVFIPPTESAFQNQNESSCFCLCFNFCLWTVFDTFKIYLLKRPFCRKHFLSSGSAMGTLKTYLFFFSLSNVFPPREFACRTKVGSIAFTYVLIFVQESFLKLSRDFPWSGLVPWKCFILRVDGLESLWSFIFFFHFRM